MKTKKLKCIVTGRVLAAHIDYYNKKLEKAGTEEELKRTYICKEAIDLLETGYTIEQIKKELQAEDNLPEVPPDVILSYTTNEYGLKRNTMFTGLTSFTKQETDPEVLEFINNME